MIEQSLNFIDEQIIGSSQIYEPGTSTPSHITESKTYPYTIKKSIDGGVTYSDVLFYGNKFLQAGDTSTKLELTDFTRFSVYTPSYKELKALTAKDYKNSGIISNIKWDIYDGNIISYNRIAGNIATVASIFRYPNRIEGLEFIIGDPGRQQVNHTYFSSLLQGCQMNNSTKGQIGTVSGYKLLPRFPKYKHQGDNASAAYCFFGMQISKKANDAVMIYQLYDNSSYANNEGTVTNVSDGVTSGYFKIKETGSCDGIGLLYQSANPSSGQQAYGMCQRICDVDLTPCARYYLMWQDRFGGYQCQPFCKGNTYSESVETDEIKLYDNSRQIIQANVQPKWEINSKWTDTDLYPIYESIFTSKVLCLIDTEMQVEHQVILTDKEYTEKTFKNQGRKMFNIKLNLEEATLQQITY